MAISGVTYSYTTGGQGAVNREDFDQIVSMISPYDTPLLTMLNRKIATNTKHEWQEDALRGMVDTLSDNMPANGASTAMRVNYGSTRWPVSTNAPIMARIDEEIIKAWARTTNLLTVVRAYNSTATAAHSSSASVEILGDLGIEGATARTAFAQTRTRPYNVTQVFDATVQITGTQEAISAAGVIQSESDYQAEQRMRELKIQIERSLISGTRVDGSTSTFRSMGGLWHYISTNKANASSAAVSEDNIDSDIKVCRDAGGQPSVLLANTTQMKKINALYKDRIRSTPEGIFGGANIQRIYSPNAADGELALITDVWVPQHEYYILDMSKLFLAELRPFKTKPLAETGDSKLQQVICEITLEVKNESAHARRYGLSTS